MASGKFERTKPHVNVGTIGHYSPGSRGSYARSLLQVAALQIALSNSTQDATSTMPLLDDTNSTGPKTYVNMNRGPMEDGRNRAERRADKKKKAGPRSSSKYKKGRWWE